VIKIRDITFACAEPVRLAEFWAAALDYVPVEVPPAAMADIEAAYAAGELERDGWAMLAHPDGVGPRLLFHRRPRSQPEHIPIHLDLDVDDREAEVERLVALGATVVETKTQTFGSRVDTWTVMRDPEGNGFCVEE
jgi:uncharacterized glyoxalase superfamily protein PhnB